MEEKEESQHGLLEVLVMVALLLKSEKVVTLGANGEF
jgi:hypothetical protein